MFETRTKKGEKGLYEYPKHPNITASIEVVED
jgi:hypothetical protein